MALKITTYKSCHVVLALRTVKQHKKKFGRKVSLEIMVQFYKKLLYYFASTRSVCLSLSKAMMETDCN